MVAPLHSLASLVRLGLPQAGSTADTTTTTATAGGGAGAVRRRPFSTRTRPAPPRIKAHKLLDAATAPSWEGREVVVKGWVRSVRRQKSFSFVAVNDGSAVADMQVVVNADESCYPVLQSFTTGAAVQVMGTVQKSQGKGQGHEVHATALEVIGNCSAETYPLQKKRHSAEYLRSIAHLRPRTNTGGAVARVRSALAFATHAFFQKEGFVFVNSPLITAS
eukprot:GSChrysophyteH2.ASY1.ANO1.473.1 assembled CDS